MRSPSKRKRLAAFTMVEMLVVIAIIGILTAILIPTLQAAIRAGREAAIRIELIQITAAMEKYKEDSGLAYPPDFTNPTTLEALLRAHIKKISRNNNDKPNIDQFLIDIDFQAGVSGIQSLITPDEALVFWLSMTSKSAEFPIGQRAIVDVSTGTLPDPEKHRIYFEFKQERLVDLDGDGFPSYLPPFGKKVPYVYFDSRTYNQRLDGDYTNNDPDNFTAKFVPTGFGDADPTPTASSPFNNVARPYVDNFDKFVEPKGFQIICAGYDGSYGQDTVNSGDLIGKRFPSGTYFSLTDRDNFASFAEGRLDKDLDN